MSKRASSRNDLFKKRKRKKNGMSASSSVLELPDSPSNEPQLMSIWHTNVEDPTSVRRSKVPVSSEPPSQGSPMETGEEGFVVPAPVVGSVPVPPKRKQKNDSVSFHVIQMTRPSQQISLLTSFNRRRWRHGLCSGRRS